MMSEDIRPARVEDAAGIARVHVDSWRTSYKGLVPDRVLENLSYEQREQMWTRGLSNSTGERFDFVAVNEQGHIVGFVAGGPRRDGDSAYEHELHAIYLLKEAQGHGLGRRLMRTFVEQLVRHGSNSMLLWVFERNTSARRFYEAMGGQPIGTQPMEIGGITLEEVCYGWKNLRALL